jgi:hypothetical protein
VHVYSRGFPPGMFNTISAVRVTDKYSPYGLSQREREVEQLNLNRIAGGDSHDSIQAYWDLQVLVHEFYEKVAIFLFSYSVNPPSGFPGVSVVHWRPWFFGRFEGEYKRCFRQARVCNMPQKLSNCRR